MEFFLNYILPVLVWLATTGLTTGLTIWLNVRKIKAARVEAELAKTEQEQAEAEAKAEAAKNALAKEITRLVADAEEKYKAVNDFLKRQGSSAGTLKKAYVETAIKAFCLENGYTYDKTELDTAIQETVKFTKSVNV